MNGYLYRESRARELGEEGEFFDYTEAEWREIECSVERLPRGVTSRERHMLKRAAHAFVALYLGSDFLATHHNAEVERWSRIEALCAELREQLDSVRKRSNGLVRFARLESELERLRHRATLYKGEDRPLRATEVRLEYYEKVIRVWTELGGDLRISRNGETSRPERRGKLREEGCLRFVRAAVRPVMGDDTPSLETVRDARNRAKKKNAAGAIIRENWVSAD